MAEVPNLRDMYPSNSVKSKQATLPPSPVQPATRPQVKAVTKAKVVKKVTGQKLLRALIADPATDLKQFLIWDVVVPNLKMGLSSVFHSFTDALFGYKRVGPQHQQITRIGGQSYVSNQMSANANMYHSAGGFSPQVSSNNSSNRVDINDIVITEKQEAEEILFTMVEYLSQYGHVSVMTFFELAGIKVDFTQDNRGWTNLATSKVVPTRGGYKLVLPPPTILI